MVARQIEADIEAIEVNAALCEERQFASRAEALDFLEFHVLDRLDGLLQSPNPPAGLHQLVGRAAAVKRQLEAVDAAMFRRLRAEIRAGGGRGAALLGLIYEHAGPSQLPLPAIGYDTLDAFTDGLFPAPELVTETREREPEMVFYQKTPSRIVMELVAKAQLTEHDVFYDIGAGLGHVCLLVHLLSGATCKGIEIEPAYCAYANGCAADLALPRVQIIQADARTADYSDGTVFFLYTPFEGRMLQAVLERLRTEARKRPIAVFTYGPCTLHLAQQNWLRSTDAAAPDSYTLREFQSVPAH